MKQLCVVIVDHNYVGIIDDAIESALARAGTMVEIAVVDDGSTDGSRAVITRHEHRVKVKLTENATQRVAANRGYAMTNGDLVVFLDSDDVLPPELPQRLAEVWGPRVSKAQFQMQRIDETGQPFGRPFPSYRPVPSPKDIRHWAATTTAYPSPPGSGNAYSRMFLDRIFPIDSRVGDFSDSACLAAAPFFGDVVCVPGVVVGYRQHGANDSNLLTDHGRFPREVERARARWRFAQQARGQAPAAIDERPLFRSRELLQLRTASHRVAPTNRPLPMDGVGQIVLDVLRAPFQAGPETLVHRILISGWCLATLLAPWRIARRLLVLRYGNRR